MHKEVRVLVNSLATLGFLYDSVVEKTEPSIDYHTETVPESIMRLSIREDMQLLDQTMRTMRKSYHNA